MAITLKSFLSRPETALPPPWDTGRAIDEILRLQAQNGGASFNLYFGNLAGERLYTVSVFPERSYRIPAKEIDREELGLFLLRNQDLLADPRCCIGAWYSDETGQTYLDVCVAVPDKRDAASLGMRYNQEGVFDLFRMEFIPTGGTGEPLEKMDPERERLPPLIRRRRKQ